MNVFIERRETEKIDKKNRYAGIDNTHHLPEHFQEHQNRSVQCAPADCHQPHHYRPQEHHPENLITLSRVSTSTNHYPNTHHKDQVKAPKMELDENDMLVEPEQYNKMEEELVSDEENTWGLDRIRSSDGHTFRVERCSGQLKHKYPKEVEAMQHNSDLIRFKT